MKFEILVSEAGEAVNSSAEAIHLAGAKLLEKDYIQPQYIQACLDREVNFPTGLKMANGEGIVIPHADYQLVKTNSISVLRFAQPVSFGQMEDADLTVDCGILFNLAFATSDQHLAVLRRLFTLFQDSAFVTDCRTLPLSEIPDYINAQLSAESA